MRISDWSSDVCSSDLAGAGAVRYLERSDEPDDRLPPQAEPEPGDVGARGGAALCADAGGSERLLSGVGQPDDRGARARGLDLGGRSRRSGALAALFWGRRRIGTRLRLSAAGAVRPPLAPGGRGRP